MSKKQKLIISFSIIFLALPFFVGAVSLGQEASFYVDSLYHIENKNEISAVLRRIGRDTYFYIEQSWWEELSLTEKEKAFDYLRDLDNEFSDYIRPELVSTFGEEPRPGPDNDFRTTVLLHQMREGVGGYFNPTDGYLRIQAPRSNQRNMVYLNVNLFGTKDAKVFLAHEFMHLITFNQKDIERRVKEEVWLNELRSEYVSTFLGYDKEYEGSNLQRRVRAFLEATTASLTEWRHARGDYGIVALFGRYLVDHYGPEILVDSLHSRKTGIPSLEEALAKQGIHRPFEEIFADWLVAVYINDCGLGDFYCYKQEELKNIRIIPRVNFLPTAGTSQLSVTSNIKNWTGNWQKITGGRGVLHLEFDGRERDFLALYLVEEQGKVTEINRLSLGRDGKGELYIENFSGKSVVLIPLLKEKKNGFDGEEPSQSYSFTISIIERTPEQETELLARLLAQIEELKSQIFLYQQKIAALQGGGTCAFLGNNLYFGTMNNNEVRCLQEFLKAQNVYPEGLITGNFLSLTRQAVIRFQEKHAEEILIPLGLTGGTGFVGEKTRVKINQLIK